MNKKEPIDGLKLTPEEIVTAVERGMRCLKDSVKRREVVYSRDLLIATIHKFIAEAQLNKVFNDPDIALIDSLEHSTELARYDAGLLNDYGGGDISWWQGYIKELLGKAHKHCTEGYRDIRDATVIPLSELEEGNDGNQGN